MNTTQQSVIPTDEVSNTAQPESERERISSQPPQQLHIKRAYEAAAKTDGFRVLVDRLWPRGISKERACLDLWMKDIAPSTQLRKWWNHDPQHVEEFSQRYRDELDENPAVDELNHIITTHHTVTLVYAAKDPSINHAVVLRDYLSHISENRQ